MLFAAGLESTDRGILFITPMKIEGLKEELFQKVLCVIIFRVFEPLNVIPVKNTNIGDSVF